jgi:hypothetical protein
VEDVGGQARKPGRRVCFYRLLFLTRDEVPDTDIVSRMIAQADLQLTKITSSEK